MEDTPNPHAGTSKRSLTRRLAPVAALALIVAAFFALGLDQWVSFEALRDNHAELRAFVDGNMALAALAFVAFYAMLVAISVPGAAIMTVTGGFLFGIILGGALTVIGATIGATVIFLVAKTALGDALRKRASGMIARMAEGFQENAFNYLLVLRLVPLFPFFVVNVAPAFLGVRLPTFVAATLIGITPATFVFASVGAGLGSVLERGEEISLAGVMTPEIITALVGLALLALIPVGLRYFGIGKKKKAAS
ncbi:MAG: TVP38/TMEM64 family protein [Salinarimonadaceae bacterium]|nr:MAG: TVP38/TMEM64 family protein [Salinarimonadaceae bacterium]